MDIDTLLAKLAEDRRLDCTHWAQTMLANPDVVPFRQGALRLMARVADGNAIPTLVETRRLANAWARFQKHVHQARRARQ
jgi:hypothetical protein